MTKSQSSEADSEEFKSLVTLQSIRHRLFAVIGYEFWNPLSTIQVCLESLANESEIPLPSRQVILDTAVRDIQHLHQLIEDCLNLARCGLDRAKITQKQSPMSSRQILQNTILRILRSNSTETNVELKSAENNYILLDAQEEIVEHICNNLIAIVGHELRTPLCTIEICLESLSSDLQMPKKYRQEMLDIALKDLVRLQKLIKDFFTLDRLETGQIYYRSEYVRVDEAIELALVSLKNHYDYTSINQSDRQFLPQIILDIPHNLPQIKVDEDRLIAALVKLLDNACKFTQADGEIKIKVRLLSSKVTSFIPKEATNMMLEIIISDNGRGMIPSHLEAVFNCFYQEEDFLRRTVNGTGIGLAICRRIINSLGGKIWANSAGKDQGSSIHLTLPVANLV
ncbi:MAG: ATP-binding protein [Pleurocapsa sp.]